MINSITKEQEALISEYIKKWVDLASEPINRKEIKKIFKKIYGKDKLIVVGESFQNTVDLIRVATEGKKLEYDSQLHSQLRSQLRSQLDSQLYSQPRSQLGSQLRSQLHSQLYSQLGSQLDSQLYSQLRSQLGSQLRSQLGSQLRSQLGSQLDSQLYSQLYSQLRSQLRSQLHSQLRSQLHSQLDSQLDSQLYSQLYSQLGSQGIKWSYYISYYLYDWAGYYDYAEKIGVEFDKKFLKEYFNILLNIPVVIFIGDVIFVCEKPKCLWENGMLHSDQLSAIGWKDGTGFYYLDGVYFEKDLWEKVISHTMSFKEIMAIEISDQRTVALKYNPQAILNEGATLVDKDKRNNELYLIEGKEINKELDAPKIWFLKMLCPTGRIFIEGCDPEEAEKNPSASAMQAMLCGLILSEYMNMTLES